MFDQHVVISQYFEQKMFVFFEILHLVQEKQLMLEKYPKFSHIM